MALGGIVCDSQVVEPRQEDQQADNDDWDGAIWVLQNNDWKVRWEVEEEEGCKHALPVCSGFRSFSTVRLLCFILFIFFLLEVCPNSVPLVKHANVLSRLPCTYRERQHSGNMKWKEGKGRNGNRFGVAITMRGRQENLLRCSTYQFNSTILVKRFITFTYVLERTTRWHP